MRVLVLGDELRLPEIETTCSDGRDLDIQLARHPDVVVTIGPDPAVWAGLMVAPFSIRRRWLHFAMGTDPAVIAADALACAVHDALTPRSPTPLVSVFTPTYRPGGRIYRTYASLLRQTYAEWEWVVVDDSDDGSATFEDVAGIARSDHRVEVYRSSRHSGRIGEMKARACALARGEILVELDHDDELEPTALQEVVGAFADRDVGFVYSDCAERIEGAGAFARYPDGWGWGFGSERWEGDRLVMGTPEINPTTIRSITSAPNHLRAWRADLYRQIGGHRHALGVGDDYELIVRTFLATRMVHIQKGLYTQWHHASNAQKARNGAIQATCQQVARFYDRAITERFAKTEQPPAGSGPEVESER